MNQNNAFLFLFSMSVPFFYALPATHHLESYNQQVKLEQELNNIDRLQKEIGQLERQNKRLEQMRKRSCKGCRIICNKNTFTRLIFWGVIVNFVLMMKYAYFDKTPIFN